MGQDIRFQGCQPRPGKNILRCGCAYFKLPLNFLLNNQTHKKYAYALVNTICGKKFDKDFDKISNYTAEKIHILSTHFKENLYVINYDENKELFNHINRWIGGLQKC